MNPQVSDYEMNTMPHLEGIRPTDYLLSQHEMMCKHSAQ